MTSAKRTKVFERITLLITFVVEPPPIDEGLTKVIADCAYTPTNTLFQSIVEIPPRFRAIAISAQWQFQLPCQATSHPDGDWLRPLPRPVRQKSHNHVFCYLISLYCLVHQLSQHACVIKDLCNPTTCVERPCLLSTCMKLFVCLCARFAAPFPSLCILFLYIAPLCSSIWVRIYRSLHPFTR